MKIAIFSDNFYPELSGISDSVVALAKELAERGHEINFYVPKYAPKDFKKLNPFAKELDLGNKIKIIRLFSFSYPAATGQSRLVIPSGLSLASIKEFKPDVIHSQLFFGVGLEALLAAKINKIPFIGTNHTAITEFARYAPIKAKWFKNLMLKYAVWYYNRCKFVTAPSQAVFDEMAEYGFRRPHKVISNPIDLKIFRPRMDDREGGAATRKEFNLSENTVVYAGRLAAEKNIDVIIRAIALAKEKVPTINFAMAGHGIAMESLKNLAKELGVEKEVKFLGTLDKQMLAKIYRASKIFAIASTSETQSMTLMQAFGCGLPAIGVKARALPEYINQRNGFLVEPGDYKTLAEKFVFLFKNPIERQALSMGALEFIQNFSAERIAGAWEEIYKNNLS